MKETRSILILLCIIALTAGTITAASPLILVGAAGVEQGIGLGDFGMSQIMWFIWGLNLLATICTALTKIEMLEEAKMLYLPAYTAGVLEVLFVVMLFFTKESTGGSAAMELIAGLLSVKYEFTVQFWILAVSAVVAILGSLCLMADVNFMPKKENKPV